MMATSTELLRILNRLRMVSGLDSVDFSSIKSFISQPFRYSPVFFFLFFFVSFLPNVICFEKIWRLKVSIGHFTVVGMKCPSPYHE